MVPGEKLFEESGKVTGFKVTKVHPSEGITTELKLHIRYKRNRKVSEW